MLSSTMGMVIFREHWGMAFYSQPRSIYKIGNGQDPNPVLSKVEFQGYDYYDVYLIVDFTTSLELNPAP